MTKHRFQQLRTACNLFRPYTRLLEQAVQHCCVINPSPEDRGYAFGNGYTIAEVIQHCCSGCATLTCMDFYFFVGSSCFRSEACMAEYAASEGGAGAPGITAPVALCIVLSRVVSLTTADSRSALASSELSFLLLRFCGTPQSLSIFWIRCLWARVGCICSKAIAECTRFKGWLCAMWPSGRA